MLAATAPKDLLSLAIVLVLALQTYLSDSTSFDTTQDILEVPETKAGGCRRR